ncbi:MAG: PilZ domain-containing protein [Smithella sp.]|jgi:hypothetical protein
MYIGQERRQCSRYKAGDMTASISFHDKSSGNICVEKVKPVDFNGYGISLETNIDLEIESKISLNISKGKHHASDLTCIVRDVINQGDKKRYGLQFDFAANEHMYSEELEEILANVENILKKNHNAPSRTSFRRMKARERLRRIKIIGR